MSITLDGANIMERYLDGKRQRGMIRPGEVTIVPHEAQSTWIPHITTPSTVLHVMILPQLWATLADDAEIDIARLQLREDFATPDPLLTHLSLTLLNEIQHPVIGLRSYTNALTRTLGLHLLSHYNVRDIKPAIDVQAHRFQKSLDYIEAYLAEDISLGDLAALEGLSVYHFSQTFKEQTGQSPHQYILTERVRRAQHLLDTTQLSIAEIAQEVGFSSQSHLHRHFKRLVGITPGTYRVN
ncbi:MAG: AraC family transcriptional regulator [Chloroflexota bacterium]